MTIAEFIAKWRKVELKERSAAQTHFIDLCRVFDHPDPVTGDPTGESYCFEKGAAKHGGGDGFADVWKRGFWGWEYKGKHKDLAEAYDQLLRYRNALESPPLLLCCGLDRIVIHTNFTGTVSATYEIPLEALAEPRNIEIMRAVFHDPDALRPGRTSTAVTQDAARQFAEIAAALRERGLDPAAVAHFLDRLVFCLFAEDIRLLPDMVFSRIVTQAAGDPARFCKILAQLFDTMATGGDFGFEPIRHFNGNLFDDRTVLDLTADDVKRIAAAASLDWSAVDPSIFGTLFERGLDPNTRAQLGAHFTSREDIELVVDAVVMAPLRREWAETKATVKNLLATGKKSAGTAGVPPATLSNAPGTVASPAGLPPVYGTAGVSPATLSNAPGTAAFPGGVPSVYGTAGVPPATLSNAPGRAAFPGGVPPASKSPREWHSRGYLPHFDHPGLIQTITFRLADSLPKDLVERLAARKEKTDDPALRQEIEDALDASRGACYMRDPRVAAVVQNALLHFDGKRYRLLAWVVMPNHVHVMIETRPGTRLGDIVHSWKSFTAHKCNRLLKRTDKFWQEDYYDRFIRDGKHFRKAREYIEQNPVKAKLVAKAEAWEFGSANVREDAGGTPTGGAIVSGALERVAGGTPTGGATVSGALGKEAGGTPAGGATVSGALEKDAGGTPAGGATVSGALGKEAGGTPAVPGKTLTPAQLRKARGEADSILHQFLTRLRAVKILDPACGSGNFLYVALLRLKDLEKEAAVSFPSEHGLQSYLPGVSPLQLYGIETNDYAHDLAQMTVWIGWLQWIRANGFGFPAEPILRPLIDNIRRMDAILAPAEPEWPAVDFIIGNPPFLGGKLMRRELGDAYVDRLFALWRDRVPPEADLCCYWFEKARAHIAAGKCKRAGLLATQGIRGGANREVLKRIKETGDIFWAESDRPWVLDGANVHVSMVAFDNGEEKARTLDGKPVPTINANLTAVSDIGTATRLSETAGIGYMGTTKQGPFDIPEALALEWLCLPNPHGRPNSDVLAPWINGMAVTKRIAPMWIIDFFNMSEADAKLYEAPFSYAMEHVKKAREAKPRGWYRAEWWQLYAQRPEMRKALATCPRFIVTPRVSKHRLFVWRVAPINPDCQLIIFARCDDYFFGILHSRIHEVWALSQGTQLREKESGFRYTPTTCFETFPFPGRAGVPPVYGTAGVPPASFSNAPGTVASPAGVPPASFSNAPGTVAPPAGVPPASFSNAPGTVASPASVPPASFPDAPETVAPPTGVPPASFSNAPGTVASPGYAAIAAAAKELNELRENWLNPPEWTKTETLEFPGTVGGPWDRYIVHGSASDLPTFGCGRDARAPRRDARVLVGTVRYPRFVPRDADCAARLKERTLTKLYNERPPWLADCHARLDAAVAAAYGWPADLSDEAILERLLALNQAAMQDG